MDDREHRRSFMSVEPKPCRSCGAPMIWTTTEKGKKMPVDADPVEAERGFRLVDADGVPVDLSAEAVEEPLTAMFTVNPEPGEQLYVSHFGTCPDAAQHRKPR